MTPDQIREARNEVTVALIEFVKRASQKGATPEEVEALPKVAKVLLSQL